MQKETNHAFFAQLHAKENTMITRRILILRRYIIEIDSNLLYLVLNAKSTRFMKITVDFKGKLLFLQNKL